MATCPVCQGRFDNATFCPRDGARLEIADEAGALLGGRYRLIRKIGEGAMGIVFEAEHVSIRRRVAVKILHRNLVPSAEMVERLRREAQVTSGLGHPNIVECLDFGSEDGQVYLAMEWLDGENLDERLTREPIDIETALDIAAQTCAGLAEAHERGVVHRDLKPANLFLTRDRTGLLRVKILDFGIAKLAAEHTQLTSTGVLIGTPNYMAPEQALGHSVDARADIYALGVIMYELLVGRVPFQGDTPLAVLHQHTAKIPTPPSTVAADREIPAELDALVMTCLAKSPGDRYQTVLELGAAIELVRHPALRASSPARASAQITDDDADDDISSMRPRRARWVVMSTAIVAVVGAAFAVVAVLGRDDDRARERPKSQADAFVPSAIVDASLPDAVVVARVTDAGTFDAMIDEGTVVSRSKTSRFASETRMMPDPARHDEQVAFVITLAELSAVGRDSLASGRLRVRVTVEHFAKHDVVAQEVRTVDSNGRATFTWTPRRGKHHVVLEPFADRVSLGRVRFDVHAQ